jgi:hypothetical protein
LFAILIFSLRSVVLAMFPLAFGGLPISPLARLHLDAKLFPEEQQKLFLNSKFLI